MTDLNKAMDRLLIDGLPAGLKASIDRLLARGLSKFSIAEAVRVTALRAAGSDPDKGKLTMAAVEAYLKTK